MRGITDQGIESAASAVFPMPAICIYFILSQKVFTKQPDLIAGLSQPLSASSFVAAFTGAHGLANGLDAVLDAAVVLQRRGRRDIQLLFIGDGRCKPALERRVDSQLLRNCHFLPPMPKPQLAHILRKSVHMV